MTTIKITCPITWFEQCKWIYKNCKNYQDNTNWGMWNIGLDDVYFELEDYDAIRFILIWK